MHWWNHPDKCHYMYYTLTCSIISSSSTGNRLPTWAENIGSVRAVELDLKERFSVVVLQRYWHLAVQLRSSMSGNHCNLPTAHHYIFVMRQASMWDQYEITCFASQRKSQDMVREGYVRVDCRSTCSLEVICLTLMCQQRRTQAHVEEPWRYNVLP